MNKAEVLFKENIKEILANGVLDEDPRPRYKSDGAPAHSLFITQVCEKYNIGENEFPITQLRPIAIENGIKEIQWIYQDQTSDLSVLENKYGIKWWRDWEVEVIIVVDGEEVIVKGTIGQRYGATIKKYDLMNKLLDGLVNDPFGRGHIIDMFQYADLNQTKGLRPCAFQVICSVRKVNGEYYLDLTLTQRSSDFLVAGHINRMQYVALMMMIAKHCGYRLGNFTHFVQNLHIYDRHVEQAKILLSRTAPNTKPVLKLNVPDKTNFYDISAEHFELVDYEPITPNLKFDLGI